FSLYQCPGPFINSCYGRSILFSLPGPFINSCYGRSILFSLMLFPTAKVYSKGTFIFCIVIHHMKTNVFILRAHLLHASCKMFFFGPALI
ncbi:hypothetical protein L9F63_007853, partial [Diploptera punctata]